MVSPRKRKMIEACPVTTTLSIGNCTVEFPCDADQEFTTERLSLQFHRPAAIRISVEKWTNQVSDTPNPGYLGHSLPLGLSFQVVNPKCIDSVNYGLLESTTKLYKQELPAMRFAADTGKESDFLRNCTMSGKYCTLLIKKPGACPADPEIVLGAIAYQILPTSTQYAEIPLAAVDQSCQRQGLGKLLVRELARRLTDVGVLTLFCWGDQESEHFWNKQGFLKIAEVDAQGRPQKLRLKNEIQKAMSLPGNAALMVCNLPQVNMPLLSTSASKMSPHRDSDRTFGAHMTEKEVNTPVVAQQSPIACSDVSDPYSRGRNPFKTPLSTAVGPAQAATLNCSPNGGSAKYKVKANAGRSSVKVPAATKPTLGSKPSLAKSSRTLRFVGVDPVTTIEKEASECAPLVPPVQLVAIGDAEKAGPVVKRCTERICEEKDCPTPSIQSLSPSDIESREPLRSVRNTCGYDIVAPVKKRPWKRTQCDNPNVAAAPQESPHSTGTDFGPEKENNQLAGIEVSETEYVGSGDTLKASLKRSRPETMSGKIGGRRSARKRRCDSPSTVSSVSNSAEPPVPEPTPLPDLLLAAEKSESAHHGALLESKCVSVTRDAKVVDCKQSMADESFSPSGVEHLKLRLEKQGQESTIRKRLSTRLVHVPEVGEDSQLASGFLKDSAKTTAPVVFLANMPNTPKKRALAELVEKVGGKVTGDGCECTHVIASEVRRTLNFCSALCNGAWVVTPDWLKASSRKKSFVDERPYLLRDKQFESKYKVSLASVIQAAQRKPCSLLAKFSVYPTPLVQPPLITVTKLTQAAGGKVLSSLDEALQLKDPSHTIVLVGEEDKQQGDVAAKAGLRSFTGEWLMQAIMKQKLDFETKIPNAD